jgi:Tfp pilus assembly protein PilV
MAIIVDILAKVVIGVGVLAMAGLLCAAFYNESKNR